MSTDRYFNPEGNLTVEPRLENMETIAPMIESLYRSLSGRPSHKKILSAFEEITEGLRFTSIGTKATTEVHIEEPGHPPKPLSACGDGLRDILVILLNVVLFPKSDLLIDEPGLRLHPHAQRRLLRFLETEANARAIWIATHDGVFIGAPSVSGRYSVSRNISDGTSIVESLPGRAELQTALRNVGWQPQDAVLADKVLLCEGISDKTTFEQAIESLRSKDASFGGTLVAEVEGDGDFWGQSPKLAKRIELLRRLAPHASLFALIDRGSKTSAECQRVSDWARRQGLSLSFLEKNELENYFLSPGLLREFCVRYKEESPSIAGGVVCRTIEEITGALSQHDLTNDKGASIITNSIGFNYNKNSGARIIAPKLWQHAPELALTLEREVQMALTARPSQ